MRLAHKKDSTPFADKNIERDTHESSLNVVEFHRRDSTDPKRDSVDDPEPSRHQYTKTLSDSLWQTDRDPLMAEPPSREEIDAKLAATEAHAETRFAQLIGEMRTGFAELRGELRANNTLLMDEKAGRRVTNSLVVGSAIAIAALVVAIFALGAAWFNNGVIVRDAAHNAATEAVEQYRLNAPASPPTAHPQAK